MFSKIRKLSKFTWILFFLFPLISSCSSNKSDLVEIVIPPKSPNEFSTIPKDSENPKLLVLQSADQKIKHINIGRNDPFLPPQFDSKQLVIPGTFRFHGQISSSATVNAFVSFEDQKGSIKEGDEGGVSTNLLPPGWFVDKIDLLTQSLTLSFDDNSVTIYLFPQIQP